MSHEPGKITLDDHALTAEQIRATQVESAIDRFSGKPTDLLQMARDADTLIKEIERLQTLTIGPAQAADILTAVYKGSINASTRELLAKIRGAEKRPERERPPTKRAELLEVARERLRWAEQDARQSFAVIHGHIDDNRKMQVSFVDSVNGDFLLMLEAARVLWHESHGFAVIPEPEPPDQGCTVPPPGWWCSREPGHDGPCAARRRG